MNAASSSNRPFGKRHHLNGPRKATQALICQCATQLDLELGIFPYIPRIHTSIRDTTRLWPLTTGL